MCNPILFLFFLIAFVHGNKSELFRRIPNDDGYQCGTSNVLFTLTSRNYHQCARECRNRLRCGSFFYQMEGQICTGCLATTLYLQEYEPGTNNSVHYDRTVKPMMYLGCFADNTTARVLNGAFLSSSPQMTNEMCFDYCTKTKTFLYSGSQQPSICFCGNNYEPSGKLPESDCNIPCLGDDTQMCGGGSKSSIYTKLGNV